MKKVLLSIFTLVMVAVATFVFWESEKLGDYFTTAKDFFSKREFSIDERKIQTREAYVGRLQPYLDHQGISQPLSVVLVAFKESKLMHLFAADAERLRYIKSFPILAAIGTQGPKLREGDLQVPEGIYEIEYLNPNSRFYLSMKISYPNEIEKSQGAKDGREKLGFDIMIHGKSVSEGCLAMGDEAIEELFHLATITDLAKWKVIIAPADLRVRPFPIEGLAMAPWVKDLYQNLKNELLILPWPSHHKSANLVMEGW